MSIEKKNTPPYYGNRRTARWTGLISQSGSNAPTATVIQNSLGEEVVWVRNGTGLYQGNTTEQVFGEYCTVMVNGTANAFVGGYQNGSQQVVIQTKDQTGASADGKLSDLAVEITVYR